MKLTQCPEPRRPGSRAGFTLVELLVVIAIIGVLIALTAGAATQVLLRQKQANTEQELHQVFGAFDQQYTAALDQARDDCATTSNIPTGVQRMADDNNG